MKIRTRLFLIALLPVLFLMGTSFVQYEFSRSVDQFNGNVIQVDELERQFADLTILTHEHFLYYAERSRIHWGQKYEQIGRQVQEVASRIANQVEKGHIGDIEKRYKTIGYLIGQYESPSEFRPGSEEYAERKRFADRISVRLLQELELARFSLNQLHDLNHDAVLRSEKGKDTASIVFLVAMALVIPAVSWLIYRDFARPVRKLQEGIQAIADGNTEYRIGLEQKDEIGDLSNAFDEMTAHRKRVDDLLKEANAELEARVRERTSELTAANENLAREVMERLDAERHLAYLNRTLSDRVEEETARRIENERMLIQQSKLAAMGEMVGSIAHQWRQPLNAVSAIVQDVKDAHQCGELDGEYLNRSVASAMDNIDFMSKTIDDFRNFFKPDKEKRAFDVKQTAGEVLSMVAPQMKSQHIECSLTCLVHGKTFTNFSGSVEACGEMSVLGYENECKQVFLNLVTNARDAILDRRNRDGTSELTGKIDLVFDSRDGQVTIRVVDNGSGIPEEIIGRIFEPYFTTKDASRGTGLGLYMCKMIVEKNMGGSLCVRNIEGGAEFTIVL